MTWKLEFLEVVSMVVTWWIMFFCVVYGNGKGSLNIVQCLNVINVLYMYNCIGPA